MAKRVEVVRVEVESLYSDVKHTIMNVGQAARQLTELGDIAAGGVLEVFSSAKAPELRNRATAVRASAAQALALAAELYALSGRLDQVASTYEAANW